MRKKGKVVITDNMLETKADGWMIPITGVVMALLLWVGSVLDDRGLW
jgi:hypothetical protein